MVEPAPLDCMGNLFTPADAQEFISHVVAFCIVHNIVATADRIDCKLVAPELADASVTLAYNIRLNDDQTLHFELRRDADGTMRYVMPALAD